MFETSDGSGNEDDGNDGDNDDDDDMLAVLERELHEDFHRSDCDDIR